MKTLLLFLALAVSASAQVELTLLGRRPASSGATYLVKQDFEGTGYDNSEMWIENSGAPYENPDDTTSPAPLVGSQSLRLTKNSGVTPSDTSPTFTAQSNGEIFFAFRTDEIANQKQIISLYSNSLEVASVYIRASGNIQIYDEWTFFQANTADDLSANTTYYGWFRFNFAAGTCVLAYSTDQTKPSSGNKYATGSLTTSTTFNKIEFKTTYNASYVLIDKVRVDDAVIGSTPE